MFRQVSLIPHLCEPSLTRFKPIDHASFRAQLDTALLSRLVFRWRTRSTRNKQAQAATKCRKCKVTGQVTELKRNSFGGISSVRPSCTIEIDCLSVYANDFWLVRLHNSSIFNSSSLKHHFLAFSFWNQTSRASIGFPAQKPGLQHPSALHPAADLQFIQFIHIVGMGQDPIQHDWRYSLYKSNCHNCPGTWMEQFVQQSADLVCFSSLCKTAQGDGRYALAWHCYQCHVLELALAECQFCHVARVAAPMSNCTSRGM
jgi:hypothetical protein